MSSTSIELIWAVIVGTAVLLILGVGFVVSIVVSQRRYIASQRTMLDQISKSEQKYRNLFENSLVGMMRSSADDGAILEANAAFLRMFNLASLSEAKSFVASLNPIMNQSVRQLILSTGALDSFETQVRKKDGSEMWISFSAKRNELEGYIEGVVVDITERKRAEEVLRSLSRRIIEAQELERRRVARELHDSVNQLLSSVKFRLQAAEEKIPSREKAALKDAGEAKYLLEDAIREIRRISQNLRPSVLDDLGLLAAIRSTCAEFEKRTEMVVELKSSRIPKRLPPEIELSLYRIIQESLSNVEKHSGATRVTLKLSRQNSSIIASVSDNGMGFSLQEVTRQKGEKAGFGLVGMRERVSSVGGSLDILSGLRKGTEIVVRIPLENERT